MATEAHNNQFKEQTSQTSGKVMGASQNATLSQENAFERDELVDDILREAAHYNFPKIHLISNYIEQISKYEAL